ncbi:uncharacterized protein LOC121394159 [Xenopus laevis]|uniref:Uncharacterized protein LOC121394159 n=1 Tax=Xenopus laevis TaxID=8355 RepID=A0A8J1KTV3_XENLA|nr:uncharacterized protein LOC121394159 [Xenopus laevis]
MGNGNVGTDASHSQYELGPWGQKITPYYPQASENSISMDNAPYSSVICTTELPGSVISLSEELSAYPPCITKSIAVHEGDSTEDTAVKGESWLSKIGVYRNKLSVLQQWSSREESTTDCKQVSADTPAFKNSSFSFRDPSEVTEHMANEGQLYIPYSLAKSCINKIVKDMQQMQSKHSEAIRQLKAIEKQKQDQAVLAIRTHYRDKMKMLKFRLEAYQETMEKKNKELHDQIKNLENENQQLIQEKSSIILQLHELRETMEDKKVTGH